MNSETRMRDLLTGLAGEPLVTIDVDRQIARGRRHVRRRRLAASAAGLATVLAVAAGALAVLPHDASRPLVVAAGAQPSRPAPCVGAATVRTTVADSSARKPVADSSPAVTLVGAHFVSSPASRLLSNQVRELVHPPTLAYPTGGSTTLLLPPDSTVLTDYEAFGANCAPLHVIWAQASWQYQLGGKSYVTTVSAVVGTGQAGVVRSLRAPCTVPVHANACVAMAGLPAGATAYQLLIPDDRLAAEVDRPDHTTIEVVSHSEYPPNTTPVNRSLQGSLRELANAARSITARPR